MLRNLLLIGLLVSVSPWVYAHDPGLSRGSVQLLKSGLSIQMAFAREDLQALLPGDTNRDDAITSLEASLATGIEIQSAGETLRPESVHIKDLENDALQINLRYEPTEAAALFLHIPLLSKLSRGHRQYLTVYALNGQLLTQHILDANALPILLKSMELDVFSVFKRYLVEGVWHIWIGFDHILFLLTLLLPAVLVYRTPHWQSQENLRTAIMNTLRIVTAFTIAHSITLALATLSIVSLPARLVEPIIALSVLITAINNLRPVFPASRWLLAFVFGLIHGFGFASVLVDLDLPGHALMVSLLGFNLGVEAGQLVIVALAFPAAALMRHTALYRTWVLRGGSLAAAVIATVWLIERV